MPIVVVEAVALALAVAFLVAHGLWVTLSQRALARRERLARAALTDFVVGGDRAPAESAMRELPPRSQIRLLVEIGRNLVGMDLGKLRALAADLGIVAHARRQAGSRAWHQRLRGARLLTLLDTEPETLASLLDDPNDTVRAQAIESAAAHPTPEVVEKLIGLLGDEADLCRFAVQDTLLRIGPPVIEPLAAHLGRITSPEATTALRIALGMPDHRFLEAAVELSRDPSAECRAAAAQVLAAVGGTAPLLVLESLLDDPAGRVRAAAALGLGMLQHWPAAERLAAMLRDRDFEVRRAAALGLQRFGAAGELVLRKALEEETDPFAADMARLVLGIAAARVVR